MTQLGLTRRELEARNFIAGYIREHGISPAYSEIASNLGIKSKSGIVRIVSALEERGHIVRLARRNRSIALVDVRAGADKNDGLDFLTPKTAARFRAHCRETGDSPRDAINDLIELFLEDLEQRK